MTGRSQREGYVYVIRLRVKRAFKIGRSIDPKDRLSDFMVDMPLKMVLETAFRADDYYDAESDLHERCDAQGWHLTGEWYDLPEFALRTISRISKYQSGVFYRGNGEVSGVYDLMSLLEKQDG